MPSYFIFDPLFEGKLNRQPGLEDALEEAAQPAAEAAKSFAPVRTGDYRDSIEVVRGGTGKVYLTAKDYKALFLEFGTVDTPIFSPLRRGIRSAGLRYKPARRKQ